MKQSGIRERVGNIIFESNSVAGQRFDVALIGAILGSVAVVMFDSVRPFSLPYRPALNVLEWLFTFLFTIEYVLRIWSARNRKRYVFSFFGVVDFLALLPTYIGLLALGSNVFLVIRILRLLRIFRVLKLATYSEDARMIVAALKESRRKIFVFLFAVFTLVTILGSLMYVIEAEQDGFANIPESIYWAIVTITTVGYGDLYPQTALGQAVSAVVMLLGYAIIAVPTGIFAVEYYTAQNEKSGTSGVCPACAGVGHAQDAFFCRLCGARLGSRKNKI
jgi:voltage-gated potassium channel